MYFKATRVLCQLSVNSNENLILKGQGCRNVSSIYFQLTVNNSCCWSVYMILLIYKMLFFLIDLPCK